MVRDGWPAEGADGDVGRQGGAGSGVAFCFGLCSFGEGVLGRVSMVG